MEKDPAKIAEKICRELDKYVLPVFDVLNSRDQILAHRKDYPHFDTMSGHMIPLDEAFIYGCRGDLERAKARFENYYARVLAIYERERTKRHLVWMRMGESITGKDKNGEIRTITAKFPRYVRIYSANDVHWRYLDELAEKLGIR